MSKLPTIIKPLFPDLAWRLERRQQLHDRDKGAIQSGAGQAFDIVRGVKDPSRSELEGWLKAAEFKSAYEELKRSSAEKDSIVYAIHEGYARRRHELALAHLDLGKKALKWRYKLKRYAIIYGTIAVMGIVTGMALASKFSQGDVSPHPRYQNAIDR